jgi:hypothetical protein
MYSLSFFNWAQSSACNLLHVCFLLGLLFDPKNGGDMLQRNVD